VTYSCGVNDRISLSGHEWPRRSDPSWGGFGDGGCTWYPSFISPTGSVVFGFLLSSTPALERGWKGLTLARFMFTGSLLGGSHVGLCLGLDKAIDEIQGTTTLYAFECLCLARACVVLEIVRGWDRL